MLVWCSQSVKTKGQKQTSNVTKSRLNSWLCRHFSFTDQIFYFATDHT